jgi:HEAT repeat protein
LSFAATETAAVNNERDGTPDAGQFAFVSYVAEDLPVVDRLCAALRENGIAVWRDKESLWPGDRWRSEIKAAIHAGLLFIACFSKNAARKPRSYMREELLIAVEELRLRPRDQRWFIPLRLDECEIPNIPIGAGESLDALQRIDLFAGWNGGVAQLVRTIKAGRADEKYVDLEMVRTRMEVLRSGAFGTERSREIAAYELGQIHPLPEEAVAALMATLVTEWDDRVVQGTATTLASLGSEIVAPMRSLLQDLLDDHTKETNSRAALVLGQLGTLAAEAVPLFVALLSEDDANVAGRNVLEGLRELGESAIEPLIELAASDDIAIQEQAFYALGRIGPGAFAAVPILIDGLDGDGSPSMADRRRQAAATALGQICSSASESVEALRSVLAKAGQSKTWVIRALASFGADAQVALDDLTEIVAHSEHRPGLDFGFDLRREAAVALGRIGGQAVPPLVQTLAQALTDDRAEVAAICATALAAIGPEASDAIPSLCELAKRQVDDGEALIALGAIGQLSALVRDVLTTVLTRPGNSHRTTAALEVGTALGFDFSPVVSEIVPLLDAPGSWYGRGRLVEDAVMSCAGAAVPALASFIFAGTDQDSRKMRSAREAASSCLARLSFGHDEARPIVEMLAASGDPEVRRVIAWTLRRNVKATELDKWAREIVSRLAQDSEPEIRRAAD